MSSEQVSSQRTSRSVLKTAARAGLALFLTVVVACAAALWADSAFPPPLPDGKRLSTEVVDRDGRLLRVFANSEGRWRLAADSDKVDPAYVAMLIAYEDKRFHSHHGVDPFALLRAAGQFAVNGRIVSGASTITMQVARLLEPREERTLTAKLRQMARAIQIERRLSKAEILGLYLTMAPYGGNIEGVRAAALSWFGKEPARLALHEAALLVALPQSPEMRRPDRNRAAAAQARKRVLERMADAGVIQRGELQRVSRFPVPRTRRAMPQFAPHLAQAARDRNPTANRHVTRLDRDVQEQLEGVARAAARRVGARVSVAIIAAEIRTGDIVASVGSADYFDNDRFGWIDMSLALRSPGSTLKPFIYGLAIEDGMVLPETLISDRPADFHGYRPANFDMTYQGDTSVRQALQMSLNVPAVRLLDVTGPQRLVSRFRRAGVFLTLPPGERPGLSLALGGAGLSLQDLVQLYVNLASTSNTPLASGDGIRRDPGTLPGQKMLGGVASWHVVDMLAGVGEPIGSKPMAIAYKTGTSYGYRDAWAIGFDGAHVIGVWVGRADNAPVPGITGGTMAAPVLFEAFEKSGFQPEPFPEAPAGAVRLSQDDLPVPLRRFDPQPGGLYAGGNGTGSRGLHIEFPVDGSEVDAGAAAQAEPSPIVVKLQGGVPPFRLLANGRPQDNKSRRRQMQWVPDGAGTARLTVLDAIGRSQSISVIVR
ncbi:MAG: penicillin-binding protein 1C [Rhizobiaceae bacterium]